MASENPWRARRIQVELEKLGIRVSLATVSRYLPKPEPDRNQRQRWMTFLCNSNRVFDWIKRLGIEPKATTYRSPWQNGLAERWVGIIRRELLDHVIAIDEEHLRRLLLDDVEYYNGERVHTRLRDSPKGRPVEERPSSHGQVVGLPRLGGLHHRCAWTQAA